PSVFEQFVLAIVGSTVIHATMLAAVALGAGIYWLFTGQIPYYVMFQPLSNYPFPILAGFFLTAFLYLSATMILARRFATTLGRRTNLERPGWWRLFLGQDPPEPFLLWHTILVAEPLKRNLMPPRLKIKLRSGEFFKGDLHSLRIVGDEENSVELALRNVVYRPAPGDSSAEIAGPRSLADQVVLLKSSDILWLARNERPVFGDDV
ncbi:MAG: hypothetical protein D6768_07110, partial [Chloroflexi bacterium]